MVMLEASSIQDLEAICSIYNEYVDTATMLCGYPMSACEIQSWIEPSNSSYTCVMKENNEIVGWGRVYPYSAKAAYCKACETSVYVTRAQLGRGLGAVLKTELIRQAETLGYTHMSAFIVASNTASISMNLKLGYQLVGKQSSVAIINGLYVDIAILQLNLGTSSGDSV